MQPKKNEKDRDVYATTALREKAKKKLILQNQTQMKKIKFLLPILFILGFLNSCDEDNTSKVDNTSLEAKVKLVTLSGGKEMKNGTGYTGQFLSFATEQDFIDTYNQLETAIEANDTYIMQMIGSVDDEDELDSKFAQYNLDEYKPLIDFENQYGLHSLRKELKQQEDAWLAIQGDDFDDNDPDNYYIFDTVLRTLLNKDGEVMIAGKIIRNEEWGVVSILNMDTNAYYQKYPCDYTGMDPNVEFDPFNKMNPCDPQAGGGGGGNNSTCKIKVSYDKQYKTSKRRKMMTQVKLQRTNTLNSNRFIARTRYFKKVAGIWFRKRANLYVKMEGNYQWADECNNSMNPISKEKYKYAGEVEVKYVNPMPYGAQRDLAIKNNSLYSTHKLWNANTKIMDFYDGNP